MKKLLVGTAAIGLAMAVAAPAKAEVKLGLDGYFKGYVDYTSQTHANTTGNTVKNNHVDILRDTEVHFTGETTLDNGLTVGAHIEATADTGDNFGVDESYGYFSGAWGRVNLGTEDGANYLLQVAAPSADSNLDGLRQYIQPVDYNTGRGNLATAVFGVGSLTGMTDGVDYDNDVTRNTDKITYLTPVFQGFQAGVSYTPSVGALNGGGTLTGATGLSPSRGANGNSVFGTAAANYNAAWEGALRYEGNFQGVGLTLGGGYSRVQLEHDAGSAFDNYTEWNLGAAATWEAFGLGVVYTKNNNGLDNNNLNRTWVVGADYTTGPYKLGISWLNNHNNDAAQLNTVTGAVIGGRFSSDATNRYTGGVVYTYGPGLTFRGSVSYIKNNFSGIQTDVHGTTGLIGTQIEF
jgi:hypothetical protein